MKDKIKTPKYIKFLVKNYPNIISGRKNFGNHHLRVIKTIGLVKKYFNNKIK